MTERVDLRNRKGRDRVTLDWTKVREIRERRKQGETTRSSAASFDVTQQTIYLICANRTWQDPNYEPPVFAGKPIVKAPVKKKRGRPPKNPRPI